MLSFLSDIAHFVEPMGMTVILVYTYGCFSRTAPSPTQLSIGMGAVFGLAAMVAMASPLVLGDGIIIDLRNLFVGISAAFFGWRAAVITLFMTILTRLGIGGAGVMAGVTGLMIAASMGLFWAYALRPKLKSKLVSLGSLGVAISMHLLSAFVFPWDFALQLLSLHALELVVLNFAGTAVFALLIFREQSLMGETSKLLHAATTDPLTKVLNRRSVLDRYVVAQNTQKAPRGMAMVCIDLDRFKAINDDHGHLVGDRVLIEMSRRISSCLRDQDLFARMSGDEFLIVLSNVASREAHQITERCRRIVSGIPISAEGISINATISIGTVWSPQYEMFGEFRDAADTALYTAKSAGRNCVAFNDDHDFTPSAAFHAV